jgi:tRNA U34 5-methylaminomethyl-2-thiouridine-forming methyltransferase MnmC
MTACTHNTHFDEDGLLFSDQFGDHYFSRNGGAAECLHVFLAGNNLPKRWENGHNFNIGELGFGTGLNFLTTWQIWQQVRQTGQHLTFTSVEAFPVDRQTAQQALAPYEEFGDLRDRLLAQWMHAPLQIDAQTTLQIVVKPVEDALREFPLIDAWILDGFAPAKNPDMWSLAVMQRLAEQTADGGTFASYTAAGWVRRNLQQAGFAVEKRPGFGTKRDMIAGRLA